MFVIKFVFLIIFVLNSANVLAQGVILKSINSHSKKPALYKLEFSLKKPFEPKAAIRLRFPKTFDLSTVKIVGSNDVKGGFTFVVDSAGLVLQRSGLGATIPAGQNVSVIFGPIQHAAILAKADSVEIQFFLKGMATKTVYQAFKVGLR